MVDKIACYNAMKEIVLHLESVFRKVSRRDNLLKENRKTVSNEMGQG